MTMYAALTVRTLKPGSSEEWRKAWKDWEGKAVASITDNLFKTTAHVPGPPA